MSCRYIIDACSLDTVIDCQSLILTTARSLQAARRDLVRQNTTDSLRKNLEKRPDRDALVESMFSFSFPSIFRYPYNMLVRTLYTVVYTIMCTQVHVRPIHYIPKQDAYLHACLTLEYIGNILPSINAAPALQANARDLERNMRADNLEQKIQNRPLPEVLINQGILGVDEDPRSA